MDGISWARKYRPSSFDDYMGDNVKKLVVNRLKDRNSLPQTIMLYGTRGTGKTSMARLMCKEILCLEPVDGHSCGKCDMCMEIDEYISSTEAGVECTGIIEVNAANTTGKSDIDEIVENAMIPPVWPATKKIVILDECHKLSNSAQNSLLKVIEEPPDHLIFILCTTEPEGVIGTIHSRMQMKVEVKKKTIDEIVDRLEYIAQLENLTVSREALQLIAKKEDRIPRECIMKLETIAKNYGNVVNIQNVRDAIGDVSTQIYLDFFKAANTSLTSILNFNVKLKEKDINAKLFMSGLTRFVLDCIYVKSGINLEDFPVEFLDNVKQLFSTYNTSELDTLLQIIESSIMKIDSDDTKSELIITNMALRIGKVKLLARGLSGEVNDAIKENKESIKKYSKKLEEKSQEALEKIPDISVAKEAFASYFTHMSEVSGGEQVIPTSDTPSCQSDNIEDSQIKKILDLMDQGEQ